MDELARTEDDPEAFARVMRGRMRENRWGFAEYAMAFTAASSVLVLGLAIAANLTR
ncbi:hypothetical protein AB0M43_36135 [Longispora sp. NPDC051575]|uniref:hypothetical protein n=1 Tax=Longispora sp. NPDC051575 TaxID=3154943 RepID=UPI003412BC67